MGILLSWTNLADAAGVAIAVDSEAAGLGLRSLLTPQLAEVWRSNAWGATTINLRVDFGTARSINTISVGAPRDGLLPGTSSTIRVTADATTLDGTTALDTTAAAWGAGMTAFGMWGWSSSSPISARYVRFQFAGAASDSYLQLGRLWIGAALITTRQASYGYSHGVNDPGGGQRAALTGVRDVQRGRTYRTLACSVPTLTTAEADQVQQAAIVAGSTGQVLAARLHSDIGSTGLFGVMTRPPAVTRAANSLWRSDFLIEEDA